MKKFISIVLVVGKYSEREHIVVLYLPNEPQCDFIIKDREIINGDLCM